MKKNINKDLSHLTYTRVYRSQKWMLSQMLKEIEDAFTKFIAALQEDERSVWQAWFDRRPTGIVPDGLKIDKETKKGGDNSLPKT